MSPRRHFCTLFDSNYLTKAVAMHGSLVRHCPSFELTAYCFDDAAKEVLDRLELPNVRSVSLGELEAHDRELAGVKSDRTPVEYCWTATPALPLHVFHTRPEIDEVTYIDADLLFFADPEPLFVELGDASVLITAHNYAPRYASRVINGVYNVQFLTFRRDEYGMRTLQWWHDRCIEWCYYRLENGKLGDQKYLDDWPERFEGVHVLQHKGGGVAPWNVPNFEIRRERGRVMVDESPLVFFHYHRVRLRADGDHEWRPPGYEIPDRLYPILYQPYLDACNDALGRIRSVAPGFSAGLEPGVSLRDRIARTRADVAARAVARFPLLFRLRHPSRSRL